MGDDKRTIKTQILHLLKMQGAQTASALAEQLQVSPMAIRQHLQTLKAAHWVTYQEERRPLGRPVKLWQLTTQSDHRFPDSHADLTVDLLRDVEAVFGAEGVDRLMAERSRRQLQTYQTKIAELVKTEPVPEDDWQQDDWQQDNWQHHVRAIAQLRTQEGYMAEVIEQPEETLLLVENHCPISSAAQTCQKFCSNELDIFRAVLGSSVTVERVEHILQGDRRCAYRIRRLNGRRP